MRPVVRFLVIPIPLALALACSDRSMVALPDDALLSRAPGPGPVAELQNFGAPLEGAQEVPSVSTRARGLVTLQLSKDGSELHYQLNVANIHDVLQAHIHCGPPGVNGPVVVWLYPSAPPATLIPGRSSGVLGTGTATDADVIARPDSEACPGGVASLADVIEKLGAGGAYANVHTVANPPGEIRGQIEALGPHH